MSSQDIAEQRRRLLAGSYGPERVPSHRDAEDPRWFEPLHVRDESAARERIAAQIVAGADVVLAPTWLTHRRALLPLGETRRARDWTAAAVRVARDGIEVGLEQRQEAALDGEAAAQVTTRPEPLVGAPLPVLDERNEPGTGHLLPREAATQRDYRDQAGLLADAEPDLILVEGTSRHGAVRNAVEEAADTGLPVWAGDAVSRAVTDGDGAPLDVTGIIEHWVETSRHAGAEAVLVAAPLEASARIAADSEGPWGALLTLGPASGEETVTNDALTLEWLDHGAQIIALLNGASPRSLAQLRHSIDEREAVDLAQLAEAQDRWVQHVAHGAAMAQGGAALWLAPPDVALPGGFDWLILDPDEARNLPLGRYQLIVTSAAETATIERLAHSLQEGGLLALSTSESQPQIDGLRLMLLDDDIKPPLAIMRRET